MKLVVLAQVPPPVHGQSLMVKALVDGLPGRAIELTHVNLALSRDAADIGRWRVGKIFSVLGAIGRTIAARFRTGADTLYYVPAPGKRTALYRDWMILALCRPFFRRLVLHWHAPGLGQWLNDTATPPERFLTRAFLGEADLSLVLASSLEADLADLAPDRIAVVANGVPDPGAPPLTRHTATGPFQLLFIGLCSEEKGLFAAAEAVLEANRSLTNLSFGTPFSLVAAGAFPDAVTHQRFEKLVAENPAALRYVGTVNDDGKKRLFRESHCLCLPTSYPAEGQPLVLLEAMAHDLPIVATRWRAVPKTVPPAARLVDPDDQDALVSALLDLRATPPEPGLFRKHYVAHYTLARHLDTLAAALRGLEATNEPQNAER